MNRPPETIDGAKVLHWAWSGSKPYGFVGPDAVYGLAICQYQGQSTVYRFSCDAEWQTLQDNDYNTVEEAKANVPSQYQNVPVVWAQNAQNK